MAAQMNPLQPALEALDELKADVLERVGKEGGNLNRRMRSNLNTVGLALTQFNTILAMTSTIAQQTQVIAKVTNDMSRLLLTAGTPQENGGDDGTSTTKGQ
jgi:hypothetical protein